MKELRAQGAEIFRALSPLVLIIVFLLLSVADLSEDGWWRFGAGIGMVAAGMLLFLFGARVGLQPVGKIIGANLPTHGSLALILGVVFVMGLAVTLAEPNVAVLGSQIEAISGGKITAGTLTAVIAAGAGTALAVGILSVLLNLPLRWIFGAGYALLLSLSFFIPDEFSALAFDAGGFATGLVTIPFTMSLGLGFAAVLARRSTAASQGFGVIGITAMGPVLAVLLMGLWV
jgi:hypothetical protein